MQAWFHVHEWKQQFEKENQKENHNTVSITCHLSLESLQVRPLASQRISPGFTRNTSASLLEEDWCSCFLLPPPAIRSFTSLQTVYTHTRENRSGHVQPGLVMIFGVLPFYSVLSTYRTIFNPLESLFRFNARTVEIVKWWVHVGRWCCQTYPQDKMLIFNHIVYGT